MHITFVKKVLKNGAVCSRYESVYKRLIKDGLIDKTNLVVIADDRDKQSPGMVLARKYNAEHVPFFLIEDHTGVTMFDVYSDFKQYLDEHDSSAH